VVRAHRYLRRKGDAGPRRQDRPQIPSGVLTDLVQTEVVCHDTCEKRSFHFLREKPSFPGHPLRGIPTSRFRSAGSDIPSTSPASRWRAPPEPVSVSTPKRLETLQVQTRFLRLLRSAGLGDQIDGWRVCWVGGWDKRRVLFVVMVERVVRAAQE
jgi:hypothetical protein